MLSLMLVCCVGMQLMSPAPLSARSQITMKSAMPNGKGMNRVALVEFGAGCCHYNNSTKAAIRACNDAIEWNSIKVRTIIPGSYAAMRIHVHVGVPAPETLDVEAIRQCFPYGSVEVLVEKGGLLGSTRDRLPADEAQEAHMTVACACVTVGWHEQDDNDELIVPITTPAPSPSLAAAQPLPLPPPPPPPLPPQAAPQSSTAPVSSSPAPLDSSHDPAQETTPTQMTMSSAEMQSRAEAARRQWADRVLTPLESFALLADEDEIEIYDVRTLAQRSEERINGQRAVSVMGAVPMPLEELISKERPLPPPDATIILVCSEGLQSLIALDYLAEACPRAVAVEGGINAWDNAHLPVDDVFSS